MGKILIGGYCSLDRIIKLDREPKIGFTSLVTNQDSNDVYYGGCSVNVATLISKLGLKSTPMIRVGSDYSTQGLKKHLEVNNVDTSNVVEINESRTSYTYLIEDEEGNHITLFHPGAMNEKYFKSYEEKDFIDANLVLMTINSYSDNKEILKLAKKYNRRLAIGMKLDENGFPLELLKSAINYSTILFANKNEEKYLVESLKLSKIEDLFEKSNIEIMIITNGSKGSEIITKDQVVKIPILKNYEVIDTAGAGDAYIAGFLFGLNNNKSLLECGRYGAVLSSFIIEKIGCTTNAPTLEQFNERYNKNFKGE